MPNAWPMIVAGLAVAAAAWAGPSYQAARDRWFDPPDESPFREAPLFRLPPEPAAEQPRWERVVLWNGGSGFVPADRGGGPWWSGGGSPVPPCVLPPGWWRGHPPPGDGGTPEPASVMLAALGLAALTGRAWLRKRRSRRATG